MLDTVSLAWVGGDLCEDTTHGCLFASLGWWY